MADTMRGMSFNMQKDRNHGIQYNELVHFMSPAAGGQHVDLMFLNEAYYLHAEVARAAEASGYGHFHPNAARGQNWNAALWDERSWELFDAPKTIRLTAQGYQNTPPRWGHWIPLQRKTGAGAGERLMVWVVHYPPSWQAGIFSGLVKQRVALAKEMNATLTRTVRHQQKLHPHAHSAVVGDFNCSSLAKASMQYPAMYFPGHLNVVPTFNRERARALHMRRPIDDFYHSRWIEIDKLQLAGFERSDHEPPVFDFHFSRLLRS